MRILSYKHEGLDVLGLLIDRSVINLVEAAAAAGMRSLGFSNLHNMLEAGEAALSGVQGVAETVKTGKIRLTGIPLETVTLRAPLPKPSKIVAVGLNYMDHASEAGFHLPQEPLLFAKFPNSITGPNDAIVLPEDDPQVDWEVELGVDYWPSNSTCKHQRRLQIRCRLSGAQRRFCPSISVRRQAMDARQILRHLLSHRSLDDHAR